MIRSNASVVLRRLRRFQEELPKAQAAAVSPQYWKPKLEMVARKTLVAQWQLTRSVAQRELYERLTPMIVQTFAAEVFGGGVRFSLGLPAGAGTVTGFDLAGAAAYHLGQRTPLGRLKKYTMADAEQQANLEAVRQSIRDWVMLEKNREPDRDMKADGTPYSDEEIAERIMEILGVNERATPRARTAEMEHAAEGLTRAIEGWLRGEGDSPPVVRPEAGQHRQVKLDPAVVEQWFRAVLLAWQALLAAGLAPRLKAEVERLWKTIESELI
jgi:hypothetical protein